MHPPTSRLGSDVESAKNSRPQRRSPRPFPVDICSVTSECITKSRNSERSTKTLHFAAGASRRRLHLPPNVPSAIPAFYRIASLGWIYRVDTVRWWLWRIGVSFGSILHYERVHYITQHLPLVSLTPHCVLLLRFSQF